MNSISRYPNDMALPYRPSPQTSTPAEGFPPRPRPSSAMDSLLSQFTSQSYMGQSSNLLQNFLNF